MWEQPRTKYTPKNLVSEQQVRYSGKNGTNSYESYTFHVTDYDTKIVGSGQASNGDYYIQDNLGQQFKTGESTQALQSTVNEVINSVNNNTTNIQQNTEAIQNNTTLINNNTKAIDVNRTQIKANTEAINVNTAAIQNNANNIKTLAGQMGGMQQDISNLNNKIDQVQSNVNSGLATVTALTSLHPNPRSDAPIELSVGTGVYRDQAAGAVGVFIHPNDRIMLQGGFAFGNQNNYAGYAGITISLGKSKKDKK